MTDTTVIPGASDNGDGTWTSTQVTDNGDGTWTAAVDTSGYRDIDITPSLTSLSVGRVGSTTAGLFLDDIAVADAATFIGPPTVTPPATSTLKVFNGASWVPVTRSIIVTA